MRHFIRHPSDIPIEYTIGNVPTHEKEYMKNVSQGGLCFLASDDIEPGSEIHIQIPIRTPVFEAKGIVVWCRKANKHYVVGVKFADTTTEFNLRMVEQVCYIEQYKNEVLKREGRKLTGEQAAMEWIKKYAKDFPQ